MIQGLSDQDWFDAQFEWEDVRKKYGIPLPSLPSDEIQIQFTSQSGRSNLLEAFEFYKIALNYIKAVKEPRILDFGCGWGRVARFFLRETAPANLYLADVMNEAIRHLHATNNPCRIIRNQRKPPIEGVPEGIDLVFAFSVFSHFSEEYFRLWVDYFFDVLKPGGCVVFTTRGRAFIEHLQNLHETAQTPSMKENVKRLREEMPSAAQISTRHAEGAFQWFPMGWGGDIELKSDFWGEAFIPRAYLEREFGSKLVYFSDQVEHVYQAVAVIQKPK